MPIRFYFNVIVTTADLKVAKFLADDILLSDGTLGSAEFENAPYVRLRKQMSMRQTLLTPDDFESKRDVSYSKENTVFVVRANSILQFLRQFEVPEDSIRQIRNG